MTTSASIASLPHLLHLLGSRDRSSPHVKAEVALRNVSKIKQEPDTARPARTRDHLIAQSCLANLAYFIAGTKTRVDRRRYPVSGMCCWPHEPLGPLQPLQPSPVERGWCRRM